MAMSCGVGHRCSSDLALLWLWCGPAAVAPIQPPAWEPPYATGAALKRKKKKERKKKKRWMFLLCLQDLWLIIEEDPHFQYPKVPLKHFCTQNPL